MPPVVLKASIPITDAVILSKPSLLNGPPEFLESLSIRNSEGSPNNFSTCSNKLVVI